MCVKLPRLLEENGCCRWVVTNLPRTFRELWRVDYAPVEIMNIHESSMSYRLWRVVTVKPGRLRVPFGVPMLGVPKLNTNLLIGLDLVARASHYLHMFHGVV